MTTFVDFTTDLGDVVIQLLDNAAPNTVQDFLNYAQNMTVGSGYTDSFFHRLVAGFVLQGGGYDLSNGRIYQIATGAPVVNEYSDAHPNVQGTVALAKVAGDPNSGTDQFFINLVDNSSSLDTQNGGYTVFGQVTAATWPTVQAIANLPVYNEGAPFDQLPVEGTVGPNGPTTNNLVLVTKVTVTQVVACYGRGTRIMTAGGEVCVEHLAVGDRVVTASGAHRRIRWIGRRSYAGRFLASNPALHPVRFRAGSLGDGLPRRDLLVSPKHAMFVDGVLVPAECLVNGASVVRETGLAEVEYYHLELGSHDVILAEGAASETFLDDGSRGMFENAASYAGARAAGGWRAPRVTDGLALAAIRRRLDGVGVQEVRLDRPGVHRVAIAAGLCAVRLVVDAGYAPGDARRLGAAVGRVSLDGAAVAWDDDRLAAGWHPAEDGWRWTDESALIVVGGARLLEVEVAALPFAVAA